jgi:hypothetical protein
MTTRAVLSLNSAVIIVQVTGRQTYLGVLAAGQPASLFGDGAP